MDPEKILIERITHELDMDLLRELSKVVKVMDRVINGITNKSAHETTGL